MAEGPKSRAALDLDQIERQLRSSQQGAGSKSDPLAELARIVGQDDPFRALLADPQAAASYARAPATGRSGYPGTADGYAPHTAAEPHHAPAQAYAHEQEAAYYGQPGQAHASAQAYASAQYEAGYYEDDEAGYEPQESFAAAPPPRRSRKRLIAVAALGLAVLGGAGFFVLGGDPVMMADAGPSKVPPLNPGGIDIPNQNKQIYEGSLSDSQTRVVSGEEQPIDVRQIGRGPGSPLSGAGGAGSGGVADVLGEPRRVRTVSIRPDGAIIGAEPAQRPGAPAFPPPAATPAQAQPPAASVPSAATAMAPVAPAGPLNIMPPQRPRDVTVTPSAEQVAGTPSRGMDAAGAGPLQIAPDLSRSRSEPRVAGMAPASLREPTETSAAPAPSAGGFDVQVGVKSSPSEARAAFDQLQQRHPIELSGFSPIIRQAESNGRTIYRMRVGPMPRDEANALCSRLKTSSGQNGLCFVAPH
jgi:hypothetical protein